MAEALIYSLIVGIVVGISAGYLGSIMVLERMSLVGDALSHVALPGIALGLLYNFNPFFGAFTFLFVAAVVIWYVSRVTKLSFDTILGALFTLSLAVGILIVPQPDLLEALFGDINNINLVDAITAAVVATFAVVVTRSIYHKIILSMISEDLAISNQINVPRINLIYLLLVSLVVAIGIRIVGSLLVGFLVVVPAASAKNLSNNLRRYTVLSSAFGILSAFFGILITGFLNLPTLPPGPIIVIVGVGLFFGTIIAKRRMK